MPTFIRVPGTSLERSTVYSESLSPPISTPPPLIRRRASPVEAAALYSTRSRGMKAVSPALREAKEYFSDEVVGLFALDDAFELGLGGGGGLGGVELGDDIMGEALLDLDGVDGAGCHRCLDFGDIVVRDVCDELEVVGDEVVVQAHDLEVCVLGGLGDADVVVEALAHAL